MIIQTQSLTARALDWAVGVAVGHHYTKPDGMKWHVRTHDGQIMLADDYSPTTNWGQLGQYTNIISNVLGRGLGEGEGILVCVWDDEKEEEGSGFDWDFQIALCRAIVDLYLGDQVDVPEVLG